MYSNNYWIKVKNKTLLNIAHQDFFEGKDVDRFESLLRDDAVHRPSVVIRRFDDKFDPSSSLFQIVQSEIHKASFYVEAPDRSSNINHIAEEESLENENESTEPTVSELVHTPQEQNEYKSEIHKWKMELELDESDDFIDRNEFTERSISEKIDNLVESNHSRLLESDIIKNQYNDRGFLAVLEKKKEMSSKRKTSFLAEMKNSSLPNNTDLSHLSDTIEILHEQSSSLPTIGTNLSNSGKYDSESFKSLIRKRGSLAHKAHMRKRLSSTIRDSGSFDFEKYNSEYSSESRTDDTEEPNTWEVHYEESDSDEFQEVYSDEE
eukprot:TRINITY_DN8188_c0_g1_i1.p1 TRINITY_DN8188_c0_g1~~TRINITY_DN8188_c0_g1_i1.p1  ORF type:complete len:369 (-),score=91.86 TRINITY_DN8188_c0_g1_i1:1-963(-)